MLISQNLQYTYIVSGLGLRRALREPDIPHLGGRGHHHAGHDQTLLLTSPLRSHRSVFLC